MKKICTGNDTLWCLLFAIFSSALLLFPISSYAAPSLPDISGWEGEPSTKTFLESSSENHGIWIERRYHRIPEKEITVTLLSGAGAGTLQVPAIGTSMDDRPIGFGATYKTILIKEYPAILESYPFVGFSLAIRVDKLETLIVESHSLSEVELLSIAENLLYKILSQRQAQL